MSTEAFKIDDIISSVMKEKLKRYLAGKIGSEIVRQHHNIKSGKKKPVKEDEAPTNAMGTSSSTSGTGPIDTFDPLLIVKLARRKRPQEGPGLWYKK